MRKLSVNTFLTLDGVMQAPGGPGEDPSGGFTHEGWSVNYWDDLMGQVMDESVRKPFDLLLGRKTYEIFAAHWPHVSDDTMARHSERSQEIRGLQDPRHRGVEQLDSDKRRRRQRGRKLKDESGPEIQVMGSSDLIQTLLKHDLIDEFRLWIFPVLVGHR